MPQPQAERSQDQSDDHAPEQEQEEHNLEEQEVREKRTASAYVVFRAINDEAKEELERPTSSLAASGLAAGMSMTFSLVAEGLLWHHLPDAHWRPLVAKFGYCIGFLIVILGRQQLFTENTLTPILPLLKDRDFNTLCNTLRLWGVVLTANLVGTLLVSLVLAKTGVLPPEIKAAFVELGRESVGLGFWLTLGRGIFAGWLIALMVWMLPVAQSGRILVIIILTYLVGIAGFSHVIAGSAEAFYLAAAGETSWGRAVGGFIVPALIGNIIGGVALVAALNYAQVSQEHEKHEQPGAHADGHPHR